MEISSSVVASTILLIAAVLIRHLYRGFATNRYRLPYPPGPKPLPLLGNLFDVPDNKSWVTYANWRKLYGNMIHFQVPGHGHFIIINSEKIAVDLLEKRAAIYSDRVFTFIEEFCRFDFNTAFIPYSERWRQNRKTFHQSFRPSAAVYFKPVQQRSARVLLSNLLDTPTDFMQHVATLSSNIIFSRIYGLEGSSQDRPAQIARAVVDDFQESFLPGTFTLPKLLPFMRYLPSWFPGCRFKRFADQCSSRVKEMQDVAFDMALKRMDSGTTSLVGELVSAHQDDPDEILRIKNMAATSFVAAADTTASAIQTFFLCMTRNPQVQAKAQEEIDLVIGRDRLPSLEDRHSLPYVEALYREVMRWNPALPLGVPHKTTESDVYDGYYIPKGTIVVSNIWGMTRDSSIYDNPEEFRPERFLTGSPDAPFTSINNILAFGFGRRVCVGRYVADATVWLTIAYVLATFKIAKPKNEHGQEIEVPGHLAERFFCHPEPFDCLITPRSDQAETLIRDADQV